MSCDEVSNEELLREVQVWCRTKKAGRFRNWDMDDFINETWVAARCLVDDKYDRNKGSLSTFIQRFLWDVVFRIYCRQNQIQIVRKRVGSHDDLKYTTREYRQMFPHESTVQNEYIEDEHTYEADPIDPIVWDHLSPQHQSIIQMIARGMTKTQIGKAFLRSSSWVTIELRKIRKALGDQV